MKTAVAESEPVFRPAANFSAVRDSDSYAVRFNRVAMLEAVLSIRDRKRAERRLLVAALMILGVVAIIAGLMGF